MKEELFIDGTDVYVAYGAQLLDGSLKTVVSYPSAKTVVSNNWHEEDGIEADLSELHLNKKDVQLLFSFKGGKARINAFYDLLKSKPYHTFRFASIGLTRTMRLVGMPNMDYDESLSIVSFKFCDDRSPLEGISFTTFGTRLVAEDTSVTLDGIPLTRYGVKLLNGSRSSVFRKGDLKQRLARDINSRDGIIYDSADIRMRESNTQITLNCLLLASDTAEAWNNYYGLLNALVRRDTTNPKTEECLRTLVYNPVGKTVKCYYNSSSVSILRCDVGRVWLEFSLTLVQVRLS